MKKVSEIIPSAPAVVLGFETVPQVGEEFKAGELSGAEMEVVKVSRARRAIAKSLKADTSIMRLIIKADVSGSLEALETVITQLLKDLKMNYAIVSQSVGDILLSDLKLADATKATIIAFNSKLTAETKNYYKTEQTKIIQGNVIYHILEELKAYLEKIVNPNEETIIARLNILELFSEKDKKSRQVIGGKLFEGKVKLGIKFNILHAGEKTGVGKILSIRKDKQKLDVAEAPVEIGIFAEYLNPETTAQKEDILEFKDK